MKKFCIAGPIDPKRHYFIPKRLNRHEVDTLIREYALGRGRVDLLIHWQNQRIVLELKIKHREKTLKEGLEQTAKYMDDSKATEGHLLIFNPDPQKTWEEKISQETVLFKTNTVHVWNM